MALNVVPPRHLSDVVLLKCLKCGCLYQPENKTKPKYFSDPIDWEPCPHCGYDHNGTAQQIPLWKYNLIKWFRGGFKKEKGYFLDE